MLNQLQIKMLADIVEAVEAYDADIAMMNEGKSDLYKSAKTGGLDPAVIKKAVARRRALAKDPGKVEAADEMLDQYLSALDSKPALRHARVHAHDPDTGEIHEPAAGSYAPPLGQDDAITPPVVAPAAAPSELPPFLRRARS